MLLPSCLSNFIEIGSLLLWPVRALFSTNPRHGQTTRARKLRLGTELPGTAFESRANFHDDPFGGSQDIRDFPRRSPMGSLDPLLPSSLPLNPAPRPP